jgi:hypothetical protein
MTIELRRGGTSSDASTWDKVTDGLLYVAYGRTLVGFSIASGTLDSDYLLIVHPESYADMIRAMLHADPERAVKAIGVALQEGIPEQTIKEGDVWYAACG